MPCCSLSLSPSLCMHMCLPQDLHVSDNSDGPADMERMSRNKVEHGRQTHQVLQVSHFFLQVQGPFTADINWDVNSCVTGFITVTICVT